MSQRSASYWDGISDRYHTETRISCADFHYGPLLPGERELGFLPADTRGMRCLELGCGGAQNSIWLARNGADCTAVDISSRQLAVASRLARGEGVCLHLVRADLDGLPFLLRGAFDLVHSSYALPFVDDPGGVVRVAAAVLRPGGRLLLSTAHPVFAGEWLQVDDAEEGMFLPDYFHPPLDQRQLAETGARDRCRAVPLSTVFGWIVDSGLIVTRFAEPRALPIPDMDEAEVMARVPYESSAWRELHGQLARVPAVAVFLAVKPRPDGTVPSSACRERH